MASDDFSQIMAALDPAMAVVTAADADQRSRRAGCLVGFHCQASIDPPRYGVWLSMANYTYRVALQATHVGVHLLTDTDADRELAAHFGTQTGDDVDKFAGLDTEPGPGGVPLLQACAHRLVLRRTTFVEVGGDHVLVAGDPVEVTTTGPFRPLRLSQVDDLDPGHEPDDRPAGSSATDVTRGG